MNHMLDEGKVGRALRCKSAIRRKSFIAHVQGAGTPFSREWRVCYDCLKPHVHVSWPFKGIVVLYIEFRIMHIVHDHVHAAKVVRGWIAFLSVEVAHIFPAYLAGYTQKQRT